ncbi:MAG TPA: hypothetical protein VFH07_05075 [Chitinophagaceae bacterium]|jgi:hypothetical protein|nr:hypothetical protein [Chitinophagaceae bacterium]
MLTIQLIKDKTCKIDVIQFQKVINHLTKTVKLEILDEKYDFPERLLNGPATAKKYYKKFQNQITGDEVLILTDVPYDDNYFLHEHKELAIISFYDWKNLTPLPKENGLLYWICVIAFAFVQTNYISHDETTGCLNDFLGDKNGIDRGMRQAFLCEECLLKLKRKKLNAEQKLILKDVTVLLDYLSSKSRWNTGILSKENTEPKKIIINNRESNKSGEVKLFIASP